MMDVDSEGTQSKDAEPFGEIALSFSGGGVRAVGFHLGSLSYLDHVGLREDVKILSTVSGGTFVGLSYATNLKLHGADFDFVSYYRSLVRWDEKPDGRGYLYLSTLDKVYEELGGRVPPSPTGRRSVVAALAQVYADTYFHPERRFDMFWEPEKQIHLKEVIFNATEFKTGLAFRFQWSEQVGERESWLSGNELVRLKDEYARKIRLADIMSASSDIPGGLEPLFFPDDFKWPDDPKDPSSDPAARTQCNAVHKYLNDSIGVRSVALMDGGVYDNQGMASVLLASERRAAHLNQTDEHAGDDQLPTTLPRSESSVVGLLALLQGRRLPRADDSSSTSSQEAGGPVEVEIADAPHQKTRCPSCHEEELEPEDYLGIEIDRCRKCKGIWFDEGEAESLIGAEPAFGLFIISDTPTRGDPLYAPRDPVNPGGLTLRRVYQLLVLLVVLSGLSLTATAYEFVTESLFDKWPGLIAALRAPGELDFDLTPASCGASRTAECSMLSLVQDLTAFVFPLLLIGLLFFALYKTAKYFRGVMEAIPGKPWWVLNQVSLRQFIDMLNLRLSSLFAMTNDVFMNRIRFLGYALIYGQSTLRRKLISNEIDSVVNSRDDPRGMPEALQGTDQMRKVVVPKSATMGTKLWFDAPGPGERSDLDYLLACGQFTICHNLLRHIYFNCSRPNGDSRTFDSESIEKVHERAMTDWLRFKQDAFWLVDDLANREGMMSTPASQPPVSGSG